MTESHQLAKQVAQNLFNKVVVPIMDLPLTDEAIKAMGLELTQILLDEIYNRNTDRSKNDLYCDMQHVILMGDIEY